MYSIDLQQLLGIGIKIYHCRRIWTMKNQQNYSHWCFWHLTIFGLNNQLIESKSNIQILRVYPHSLFSHMPSWPGYQSVCVHHCEQNKSLKSNLVVWLLIIDTFCPTQMVKSIIFARNIELAINKKNNQKNACGTKYFNARQFAYYG